VACTSAPVAFSDQSCRVVRPGRTRLAHNPRGTPGFEGRRLRAPSDPHSHCSSRGPVSCRRRAAPLVSHGRFSTSRSAPPRLLVRELSEVECGPPHPSHRLVLSIHHSAVSPPLGLLLYLLPPRFHFFRPPLFAWSSLRFFRFPHFIHVLASASSPSCLHIGALTPSSSAPCVHRTSPPFHPSSTPVCLCGATEMLEAEEGAAFQVQREPSGLCLLSRGSTTVTYASSSLEFDIVSLLLNSMALLCKVVVRVM
jgi:hypothetical protein